MNEALLAWLGGQLRKWVFALCLGWITTIIGWCQANNVPLTQMDVERFIELVIALLLMALVSFYSSIKAKITKTTPVVVPNVVAPEVKAIVAEAKARKALGG